MVKTAKRTCGHCRTAGSPVSCGRCPLRKLEKRTSDVDDLGPKRPKAIVIEGRIRLEGEIGRGGMGTVFCGIDEMLDRLVAVKFLLPEFQEVPAMVERFRQEARSTASITHPNVIRIHSAGRDGSSDYFVAEYVDGFTLHHVIQVRNLARRYLPLSCALWVFEQMCAGLSEVHAAGVVHRDLKPSNVMIEADTGRVVIMDFGLGVIHGQPEEEEVRGGTPAYMAPELIDEKLADPDLLHSSDIYALGIMLYEMLTGRVPLQGSSWMSTLDMHLLVMPSPPSSIRPAIPEELDWLVAKCLAKNPSLRHRSCGEILELLRPITERVNSLAAGNESERSATAPAGREHSNPQQPDARDVPTLVEAPQGVVLPSRIVVSTTDPEILGFVRRSVRRMQPDALLHVTSSPAAAVDAARRFDAQVVVLSLMGSKLDGLDITSLLDGNDREGAPGVVLLAEGVSDVDKSILKGQWGAEVLPLPATLDELGRALVDAASLTA